MFPPQGKVKPPFVPKLKNDGDTSCFDAEFTELKPEITKIKLTGEEQTQCKDNFPGFSFTAFRFWGQESKWECRILNLSKNSEELTLPVFNRAGMTGSTVRTELVNIIHHSHFSTCDSHYGFGTHKKCVVILLFFKHLFLFSFRSQQCRRIE